MSQVIKHFCDWKDCKQERAGDRPVRVFNNSQMCASGNGYEHWYATFDLCVKHLLLFIDKVLENSERGSGAILEESIDILKKLPIHYELT